MLLLTWTPPPWSCRDHRAESGTPESPAGYSQPVNTPDPVNYRSPNGDQTRSPGPSDVLSRYRMAGVASAAAGGAGASHEPKSDPTAAAFFDVDNTVNYVENDAATLVDSTITVGDAVHSAIIKATRPASALARESSSSQRR